MFDVVVVVGWEIVKSGTGKTNFPLCAEERVESFFFLLFSDHHYNADRIVVVVVVSFTLLSLVGVGEGRKTKRVNDLVLSTVTAPVARQVSSRIYSLVLT